MQRLTFLSSLLKKGPQQMEEDFCMQRGPGNFIRRSAQSIPFRGILLNHEDDADIRSMRWAQWTVNFLAKPNAVQQRLLNITAFRIKHNILPQRERVKREATQRYAHACALYGIHHPRAIAANFARMQGTLAFGRLKLAILRNQLKLALLKL